MSSSAGLQSQVHADGEATPQLPPLPAAPASKIIGQGYSAHNPIPTIQGYQQEKKRNAQEAEEYAALMEKREKALAEKEAREKEIKAQEDLTFDSGEKDDDRKSHVETIEDGRETSGAKNQSANKGQGAGKGANEKSELMDRMNANQCRSYDGWIVRWKV